MKGTALLVALVLCGASPAHAITCSEWNRLYENQKVPTVYSMIDATVAGSEGRSMRVSRGAVGRCLKRRAQEISYAFDDTCGDSSTANMHAVRKLFKSYTWDCVNSR